MNTRLLPLPEALPGPFAAPANPQGIAPTPEVLALVRHEAKNLLESAPAYRDLSPADRKQLAFNLVKIGTYAAELLRDQFLQARKLGQRPVLVAEPVAERAAEQAAAPVAEQVAAPFAAPVAEQVAAPFAAPAAEQVAAPFAAPAAALAAAKGPAPEEFAPRAVDQAGRVTRETLNAIAFPTFVADLLKGTFQAIVDSSIQQMEAYVKLLANVAKTVDQFMADNITDNQARDYLAQGYPDFFRIEVGSDGARLKVKDSERDPPDWKGIFGLNDDVALDDESAEKTLVPAARRQLAQNRHQMLSTMVLMGINRVVVTSGLIKAKMGFHLEARDAATAESASQFDFKHDQQVSAGGGLGSLFGGPSFKARTSIAYVSTTKRGSTDEINMETDLTAEVELKFKSDYFPLERFAKTGVIAQIQQNTANPQANAAAPQNTGGTAGR